MKKRVYGSNTMRQPRRTHTDRFNECQTWEEIQVLPLYGDWIKTVPINLDWIESCKMVSPDAADSRMKYEDLCNQIDDTLNDKERTVFYAIAEQSKSLRVLAKEMECSHQTVNNIYTKAQNKLQKALGEYRG